MRRSRKRNNTIKFKELELWLDNKIRVIIVHKLLKKSYDSVFENSEKSEFLSRIMSSVVFLNLKIGNFETDPKISFRGHHQVLQLSAESF